MSAAAVLVVMTGLVLRRWGAAAGWTARYRLAAITGALVAHTAFGIGAYVNGTLDTAGLTVLGTVMVVALAVLDRRLRSGVPPQRIRDGLRSQRSR